jgi:hypothetical protein
VLRVPCGTGPKPSDTKRYGNMITREDGDRGLNFLDDGIFRVARSRIAEGVGTVEPFRLLCNLLSSQPMCFNLFGPLVEDPSLATTLWRALLGPEVAEVVRVCIEHAPEPASEYLADRTAFDAFVEYRRTDGALCFTGVETKLTEPFSQHHYASSDHRYARWLDRPDIPWRTDALARVDAIAHNQLWRDHLLVFALRARAGSPYAAGALMLVRHDADSRCEQTVRGYQALLKAGDRTFLDLPLSRLVGAWQADLAGSAREIWIQAFQRRYLGLDQSDPYLHKAGRR